MNITTNNVEVSTPFFHENNTAAMNTHASNETPASTVEPVETASLVETVEPTQNNPMENTIFHVIQASLSYAAHNKQHDEECRGIGHPGCKTILDNIEKEYQKMEKSKELVMQLFKPTKLVEDTNPVPWRWENRTAVPVEQRGACLLYRPVTYENASFQNASREHKLRQTSQEAPFCFLHENDVVDNGTVMCLKARLDECFYGNETMKAMVKVLQELKPLYHSEVKFPELPEISTPVVWLIILFFFVVGAWKRSAPPLP